MFNIPHLKKNHESCNFIELGVGHIPYSFRDVQGLLLASAQNTEYKAPSSFTSLAIDRLLSFCWWKSIQKILGLPTQGSNPGSLAQQAGVQPPAQYSELALRHQSTFSLKQNKHRSLVRIRCIQTLIVGPGERWLVINEVKSWPKYFHWRWSQKTASWERGVELHSEHPTLFFWPQNHYKLNNLIKGVGSHGGRIEFYLTFTLTSTTFFMGTFPEKYQPPTRISVQSLTQSIVVLYFLNIYV